MEIHRDGGERADDNGKGGREREGEREEIRTWKGVVDLRRELRV
jgi:hypothetical protein